MGVSKTIWSNPSEIIRVNKPDHPVLVFSPAMLQQTAVRFIRGFPGLVTYDVKSNPAEMVIENLAAAGLRGFDVAAPDEIDLIRRLAPNCALHYHNPVRGRAEIAHAVAAGVRAWSVDSRSELTKLVALVPYENCEISVRFKLADEAGNYNPTAKFGATQELAVDLLREVEAAGFRPSLTFQPGSQVTDPMVWDRFIRAAAAIAGQAGVRLYRLNVGGGFPNHRKAGPAPNLEAIFTTIGQATGEAFGESRPALVCEPGRGLVGDAFTHITRVKALRDGGDVFLNDGIYGGLAELPLVGNIERLAVYDPEGRKREGAPLPRMIFGPTCDPVDRLPGKLALPDDLAEEDFIVFHGMGAYSAVTNTHFSGFGKMEIVTALSLV
ncbi:type III PLP-dependent enzyme [Thioclava sp. GXIMD4216]|uniref:Type III PLP-dependent enzyme n=1 Tax=Thioclava litoralis TaxID=3076557 RepID=A0ABZ1DVS3_9RHOB|nr:type III PLP-dependent enzyme [Thioclava sp. FTW29]